MPTHTLHVTNCVTLDFGLSCTLTWWALTTRAEGELKVQPLQEWEDGVAGLPAVTGLAGGLNLIG